MLLEDGEARRRRNKRELVDARPTSFPGSSLFLPRESTLVAAGHVSIIQIKSAPGVVFDLIVSKLSMEEKVLRHRRYFES